MFTSIVQHGVNFFLQLILRLVCINNQILAAHRFYIFDSIIGCFYISAVTLYLELSIYRCKNKGLFNIVCQIIPRLTNTFRLESGNVSFGISTLLIIFGDNTEIQGITQYR